MRNVRSRCIYEFSPKLPKPTSATVTSSMMCLSHQARPNTAIVALECPKIWRLPSIAKWRWSSTTYISTIIHYFHYFHYIHHVHQSRKRGEMEQLALSLSIGNICMGSRYGMYLINVDQPREGLCLSRPLEFNTYF